MQPNPLQDDYTRFPKNTRGGPKLAARILDRAANGRYTLTGTEIFWRDVYHYLLSRGYHLRPRYAPGWIAPWIGTDIYPLYFEESVPLMLPGVIDARRASDDTTVAIKWIPNETLTRDELAVQRFVSTDTMKSSSRNHCNPLLDSFPHPTDPDGVFIVTPWLTDMIELPLAYVNDVVDMMLQVFEGLVFLHEHKIAHRDCSGRNILQDARSLFPGRRCHPLHVGTSEDLQSAYTPRSRCMANVRYYFIDFGISSRFEGPGPYRVTGTVGRDPTPPELSDDVPYDPFPLDVYLVGNHFLAAYVEKYSNLEFLRPLLLRMTRGDPASRPPAELALLMLQALARRPSGIFFRWRLQARTEGMARTVLLNVYCLFREMYFQLRHVFLRTDELSFGRP